MEWNCKGRLGVMEGGQPDSTTVRFLWSSSAAPLETAENDTLMLTAFRRGSGNSHQKSLSVKCKALVEGGLAGRLPRTSCPATNNGTTLKIQLY